MFNLLKLFCSLSDGIAFNSVAMVATLTSKQSAQQFKIFAPDWRVQYINNREEKIL